MSEETGFDATENDTIRQWDIETVFRNHQQDPNFSGALSQKLDYKLSRFRDTHNARHLSSNNRWAVINVRRSKVRSNFVSIVYFKVHRRNFRGRYNTGTPPPFLPNNPFLRWINLQSAAPICGTIFPWHESSRQRSRVYRAFLRDSLLSERPQPPRSRGEAISMDQRQTDETLSYT